MRGSIKQRAKGTWSIILELGRDPVTGKRKQKWETVRGTKKEAERRRAELKVSIDSGAYITPSRVTLTEFLRRWLKDYAEINTRPRTYESYERIVEKHLIPALGNILLSKLNPATIQHYYHTALKEGRKDGKGGLSARTVLRNHRVLRQALSHAVKWEVLLRNPTDAVDPPRPAYVEMKTLDEEGLDILLDEAEKTPYFHFFHLAAFTGLRRSELMGLRWKDVDLIRGTLRVTQVVHRLSDGSIVAHEPKTAKSRRQVALSPETVATLKNHLLQQEQIARAMGFEIDGDQLVFSKLDGSPVSPITINHTFARIRRKIGFEGVRLHDLRHTHASLLMKRGVYPKVVQERLGHSSIAVTMDIYSHMLPGMQEEAAAAFDQGLKRRAG